MSNNLYVQIRQKSKELEDARIDDDLNEIERLECELEELQYLLEDDDDNEYKVHHGPKHFY